MPRWLLSGILIGAMTAGVLFGRDLMLRLTSVMVYPLVFILLALSIYFIPRWNTSMLEVSPDWAAMPVVIWMAIPLIVFSFNHSPIISQFTKDQRQQFGDNAVIKTDMITGGAALMLTGFVMFFVFSVVLSLSPAELKTANDKNISVLSHMANIDSSSIISYLGPIVSFTAIVSSYFGHFLGAHEGLVGLIKSRTSFSVRKIQTVSMLFIVLTTWIVAIKNPNIIYMIETLGAPMIAAILFILPVVAMRIVPAMKKFSTSIVAQIFTIICGLAAITSVLYGLLQQLL
ncbi:hypothetical protein PY546_20740 [Providencia stuartii]|nr:hypothetical protein [Providencia stuartii]